MQANSTHPDYDAAAPAWSRARDVLAGEDAVKAAGGRYLPRLDSQSDDEYAAYKTRAAFFGATARTVEEYLDLIFRRAPVLALGANEQLKNFVADCDLWGSDFLRYARHVLTEVLSVGRAGSLAHADNAASLPASARARRACRRGRGQPPKPPPLLDSNFTVVKFGTCREPMPLRVQPIYRKHVARLMTANLTMKSSLRLVKFGQLW